MMFFHGCGCTLLVGKRTLLTFWLTPPNKKVKGLGSEKRQSVKPRSVQIWFCEIHSTEIFFRDGCQTYYCWWKKSCTSWYGKYPMICRVLYIPGGAGFLPSTVPPLDSSNLHHLPTGKLPEMAGTFWSSEFSALPVFHLGRCHFTSQKGPGTPKGICFLRYQNEEQPQKSYRKWGGIPYRKPHEF